MPSQSESPDNSLSQLAQNIFFGENNSNIMFAAIVSLLLVLVFVLLLHMYAKWFLSQAQLLSHARLRQSPTTISGVTGPSHFHSFNIESSPTCTKRLDSAAVSAIPLFFPALRDLVRRAHRLALVVPGGGVVVVVLHQQMDLRGRATGIVTENRLGGEVGLSQAQCVQDGDGDGDGDGDMDEYGYKEHTAKEPTVNEHIASNEAIAKEPLTTNKANVEEVHVEASNESKSESESEMSFGVKSQGCVLKAKCSSINVHVFLEMHGAKHGLHNTRHEGCGRLVLTFVAFSTKVPRQASCVCCQTWELSIVTPLTNDIPTAPHYDTSHDETSRNLLVGLNPP
ncbi:hypothetical protein Fmac_024502 [Flemingia macrophylla]|uniref:Uncharacterized protein n=1 Tax=Flemingia macrophylla TaxID=520843 RepID=A0ABD1LPK2_9FABA